MPTMTDREAAWVRRNVWTNGMRKRHKNWPSSTFECDCSIGADQGWISRECRNGNHTRCKNGGRADALWETLLYIRDTDSKSDERLVLDKTRPFNRMQAVIRVWLADRDCRSWCRCDCDEHAVFPEKDAAWIRANVWTEEMRRSYIINPTPYRDCACNDGSVTWDCHKGNHDECYYGKVNYRPEAATTIRHPGGIYEHWLDDEGNAKTVPVYYADRVCRSRCSCDCEVHQPKPRQATRHAGRDVLARVVPIPGEPGETRVTVNNRWVFTYRGLSEDEAEQRVCRVIDLLDKHLLPGRYAPHWYPTGEEGAAHRQRYPNPWSRGEQCIPETGPRPGDLVDFQPLDIDPDDPLHQHAGPAVVLQCHIPKVGRPRYELHTQIGVVDLIPADDITLVRPAVPNFPDETAAWIRDHVWTDRMRKAYRDLPAYYHSCACQYGPSGHCGAGRHHECSHRKSDQKPSPESWITRPNDTVIDDKAGQVWLADRECVWRCPCDCHQADAPTGWAALPMAAKAKAQVESGQFDLFTLA